MVVESVMSSLNPSYSGVWFRRKTGVPKQPSKQKVLILLILEYGFGAHIIDGEIYVEAVLILLILEYGFGALEAKAAEYEAKVLILLILEYGFGD